MEFNLNSRFDDVSVVGKDYDLVSHSVVKMSGENGEYSAIVAKTTEGKRILFSGKALVDNFGNLESLNGNPYRVPVRLNLEEVQSRDGKVYKVVKDCKSL